MQSFEPVFMLTSVPGEVAAAAGGVMATAIAALYKNGRSDAREALNAMRDQREAVDKLTNVVNRLIGLVEEEREGKRARNG